MKFIRAAKALIILMTACVFLAGCNFSTVSNVDWLNFGNTNNSDGEDVTLSGDDFEVIIIDDEDGVSIEKPESQKGEGDKITSAGQAYNTVTEVYYEVADSVVEITTETVQMSPWGQYVSSGAGSGVIIDESGLIVTNYHVIENANTVTVRLTDGSEYSASLVGYDDSKDLAVIRITPQGKLTVAQLGCSADLEVGEDVVALGNPLGTLGGTLTTGIISAKERKIVVENEEMVLLQTNAAINPGNSGGGLFNMAGQLVGIVNAKIAEEGIEGLGFAIPIDIAYGVITDLVEYGYVRGIVDDGLTTIDVRNATAAYQYGVSFLGTIIVESKFTDALKYGDCIISIDGIDIESSDDIDIILKSHSIGDEITVTVVRRVNNANVEKSVKIKLQEKTPDTIVFD
ncbi:MAG: trypsin-like serine protease [Ruminococcaceae bacterium]|nr:trypsin-like serine protease [Oscillospiraceae bacterium]